MLTAIPAEDYVACYANERQRQKARARTMDWTIPSLRSLEITPPARVVSVGCGNGIDVATLRDSGYEAYGIDMHEVEPPAGSWCQMGSALDLPFGDREFDAVISLEVIEHVGLDYDGTGSAAYTRYAAELQRVLRPGGVILIATPNRFFPVDEHGGGHYKSAFTHLFVTPPSLSEKFDSCFQTARPVLLATRDTSGSRSSLACIFLSILYIFS